MIELKEEMESLLNCNQDFLELKYSKQKEQGEDNL